MTKMQGCFKKFVHGEDYEEGEEEEEKKEPQPVFHVVKELL